MKVLLKLGHVPSGLPGLVGHDSLFSSTQELWLLTDGLVEFPREYASFPNHLPIWA